MKTILNFLRDFFEDFLKNISHKEVTKTIKKQARVAHVIPFAPIKFWFIKKIDAIMIYKIFDIFYDNIN